MSRFFTVSEAIDLRLLGNLDYQKRDKGRLLRFSKFVWQDLNLNSVKKVTRKRIKIDKRTNSINMDCSFLQLSSVNVVDKCGIEYPVYRTNRIFKDMDIVDVGETKDCGCELECGHQLCNIIKSYVAVVSTKTDKNPDGSDISFECTDRKGVDGQGFFYEQLQYPKRIFEDGVWTSTILFTENNKLCKVEVDSNGCVCDTQANIDAVCNSCGLQDLNTNLCCVGGDANNPPNDQCNTWTYYCNSKIEWFSVQCGFFPYFRPECSNAYNISELGDRIIFPNDFGWDSVIVRSYEDVGLVDLQIPIISIDTFIMGLMWWDTRFNDKKQNLADKYGSQYATLKFGLTKELNKYRVAELGMIVSPPRFVPSMIRSRTNQYEGGYNNNNILY